MKETESVSDCQMDNQGIPVESSSLGEIFQKRATESGGLKERLEEDQLGVGEGGSSTALHSFHEIHLKTIDSNSLFKRLLMWSLYHLDSVLDWFQNQCLKELLCMNTPKVFTRINL